MTTRKWGYESPACSGSYALSLFLDDMDCVVEHYASNTDQPLETRLFQAQAAANKLLQAYDKNARNTTAFKQQFIEVKSTTDEHGKLVFVPIFSTGLKQQLVALLYKTDHSNQH